MTFAQKVKSILYWRSYNIGTRIGICIAKRIAPLQKTEEPKYWLMNADRVIKGRRDHSEKQEFVRLLDEKLKYSPTLGGRTKEQLVSDFVKCERRYGIVAEEYFALDFANLNPEERNRIISRARQFHVVCSLDPAAEQWRIDSKRQFIQTFKDFLGRTSLDMAVCSFDEFSEFVKCQKKVLVKPTDGWSGMGIYELDCSMLDEVSLPAKYKELQEQGVLVEEYIRQKGILHQLNPSSVNTVRIATLNDGHEVQVFFAWMRTGRTGSVVDNLHAGGIVWPVDHHTGIVSGAGYNTRGDEYEIHPDSGIHVIGLQIPKWKEALETVKKAATLVPQLKYISWDVVISEDGISLIEANASGGFWRPYRKDYDMWSEIKAFMDRTLGQDRPMKYFQE